VVGRRDAVNLETISIKSVVKYGDVYATLTIAKILEISVVPRPSSCDKEDVTSIVACSQAVPVKE
jgi:hypothetical protein